MYYCTTWQSLVDLLWDVIFGVLAVIGKSTEEINFVANECEGMAEAGTGWRAITGQPRLDPLPLPSGCLEFIQFIAGKRNTTVSPSYVHAYFLKDFHHHVFQLYPQYF